MADIKNRRIRRGPQVEVLGPNLRKIDSGAQRGAKTAAHDDVGAIMPCAQAAWQEVVLDWEMNRSRSFGIMILK